MAAADYGKSFPSWHRQVENKLRDTRLTWTIPRPKQLLSNALQYYAPSIREQGAFYGPIGTARGSFLDIRVIAAGR
jgi:uncharacterized protein YbjT (DUF2867 family)